MDEQSSAAEQPPAEPGPAPPVPEPGPDPATAEPGTPTDAASKPAPADEPKEPKEPKLPVDPGPEGLATDPDAAPEDDVQRLEAQRHNNKVERQRFMDGSARPASYEHNNVITDGIHGGQVAGTINNLHQPLKKANWGRMSDALIRTERKSYVEVSQYPDILSALQDRGIAYLMGAAKSGREDTALMALAEMVGPERVLSVYLDDGAPLSAITENETLPLSEHGHIVRLGSGHLIDSTILAAIGGRFRERKALLIVIAPPARRVDDALLPYAIGHEAPDSVEVLERHLTALVELRELCVGGCGRCDGHCVTGYVRRCVDDPAIAEYLGRKPPPGEVVNLAKQLIETAMDGREPATALELVGSRLRELAVRVLDVRQQPPADESEERALLRRLAYRLAYATFDGSPLSVVSHAASTLFVALSPPNSEGDAPSTGSAFEGRLESLLEPNMHGHRNSGDGSAIDLERKAKLVDPALAFWMLDVAWNDYDQNREPMLGWLYSLGGDPRDPVRLRAAYAAGQLATYDFGLVYHSLIKPWATSERARLRQSAAWALELVAEDSAHTGRVRRQLRDWAFSRNAYLKDSAARAYTTDLGRLFFDDVLTNLRFIAEEVVQTGSSAVAQAVNAAFSMKTGALVVQELANWVDSEHRSLHVQAARALVYLAFRRKKGDNDWPALLRLASDDGETRTRLGVLWRHALSEAVIAMSAWDALRAWGVRVNDRGEPEDVYVEFGAEVLSQPPLRKRALTFYLPRWQSKHREHPIFRRMEDAIRNRKA
jgi:hypothetical protein